MPGAEFVERRKRAKDSFSKQHSFSNLLLSQEGGGISGRCNYLILRFAEGVSGGEDFYHSCGSYEFRFSSTDGTWRIASITNGRCGAGATVTFTLVPARPRRRPARSPADRRTQGELSAASARPAATVAGRRYPGPDSVKPSRAVAAQLAPVPAPRKRAGGSAVATLPFQVPANR